MTRFVGWRFRDWTSCFLACKFSTDDEPDNRYCSSESPLPMRKRLTFNTKGEKIRAEEGIRKLSLHGKKRAMRRLTNEAGSGLIATADGSTMDKNMISNESMSDYEDSNWTQFANDEDYIIFCFRENGDFDVVVENGKISIDEMPNRLNPMSRSTRPVSRKLNYGENTKTVVIEKSCNNDGLCIISDQKEEEENIYLDAESVSGGNFEERTGTTPAESSDSIQSSNASTGSFAFPALGWEWIGSPQKMPKSDALHFRKQKARCVGFQCCRF